MTTVKAKTLFDEPITQEVLTRATEAGRKRTGHGFHATAVQYVPQLGSLLFSFMDNSAVALPVSNYPELTDLDEFQLQSLSLAFGGSTLYLESHDLHVSIAGMVSASQPLMAMAKSIVATCNGQKISAAKSTAARENGRKGGRPKLTLAV